jgi:membrane-bound metal-dependent hydrolase YbcI (DUF457 family)
MFILGHVGISLGIVFILIWYYSKYVEKEGARESFIKKIDFRIFAISAMFPDIVDKTVGMLILGEEVSNGRIFTHSIVILTILSVSAFNYSKIKLAGLFIPLLYIFPAYLHLLLDRLWEEPATLLWPLLGTRFPRIGVEFGDYFGILFSNSYVYITEIIGLVIIILIVKRTRLYLKSNLKAYFKRGRLNV